MISDISWIRYRRYGYSVRFLPVGSEDDTVGSPTQMAVFETVLSDPVGDKVHLLQDVAADGYQVVLIFIQIADAETSIQRVSMRVAQGGHDVPDEKLRSRFARTRENLDRAIVSLPHVIIFDNSDLSHPYRSLKE